MKYYNEFKEAYEAMPDFFSSFDFAKKARENGVPAKITEQGHGRDFLLKHTPTRQMTAKTWWKNSSTGKQIKEDKEDRISEAIKLLKEKGYKILKPINEWVEL